MAKRGLGIEDLLRLVFVSNPSISPEGRTVAYVATRADAERNRYHSSIWLADEESYRPLTGGPGDSCPSWSPDGKLIAFSRREEGREGAGLYIASPDGGEPWLLYWSRWGASSIRWSPKGRWISFTARAPLDDSKWVKYSEREVLEVERIPVWFNGEGWVFDRFNSLFIASYPGGEVERIVGGARNVVDYDWSPDGRKIVVAYSYDMLEPYKHRVAIVDLESREETVLLDDYTVSGVSWSLDGYRIAVRGHRRERGFATHHKIYLVDPDSGSVDCLTCDLDRNTMNMVNSDSRGPSCVKNLYWGPDGRLYFTVSDAGRVHLYRATPKGGLEAVIKPEEGVVDEFSVSSREPVSVAYTYMTPVEPKEAYIYRDSRGEGAPKGSLRITGHNEWVKDRGLPRPRRFTVESPSGGSIDAWILSYEDGGPKPWILYIHGGPKTSYGYGFIHEFHVLASRGFAVVYSNPRGSDGYSEEFADIRGRYGDVDYKELMAVADAVARFEGLVDPQAAGVTGGSYGGFMTNWIVTHTSRFKAAVTQRSCSNWISFYGESDIGWYFATDQHRVKPPWEDYSVYIEKSPLFLAHNVETPLLIIHSTEDYRCPLGEAIQFFTALKVLGKKVKLAVFPGETHDLSRSGRPKQRMARLREIVGWFESHLKAGGKGG